MTRTLPAIDAHAHVLPAVSRRDLLQLDALVFPVTREGKEWEPALRRHDELAIWGIGVHPALPSAIADFDAESFSNAVDRSLLVGEVGLDGRSRVPMAKQRFVFDSILELVADRPRPVSIHSAGASRDVLDSLCRRPVAGPILHWWRGSRKETEEAVELGCFFSLNGAEVRRPEVIDLVPSERVLTETDFPHTRRRDPAANRPAAVATIENALMERWAADHLALRRQLWHNVGDLFSRCSLLDRLPAGTHDALLAAGVRVRAGP